LQRIGSFILNPKIND